MSSAIEEALNAIRRGKEFGVPLKYQFADGVVRVDVDVLIEFLGNHCAVGEALAYLGRIMPLPEGLRDGVQWYPAVSETGNPECSNVHVDGNAISEIAARAVATEARFSDKPSGASVSATDSAVEAGRTDSSDEPQGRLASRLLRKIARGPAQLRIGDERVAWAEDAGRLLHEAKQEQPEQEKLVQAMYCGPAKVVTTPRGQLIRVPDSCSLGNLRRGQRISMGKTESVRGLVVQGDGSASVVNATADPDSFGSTPLF